MLTTNLLPRENQKTIQFVKVAKAVQVAAVLLVSIMIVNTVLLLPTILPLFYERRELLRELEIGKEAQKKFETADRARDMRLLSQQMREMRAYLSQPQYASKLLGAVVFEDHAGITLETVTVSESGQTVIGGIAATRGALLTFESALKKSGYFESITSPLSNIVRDSNIRFTIQGKVRPNILSK